MFSDKGSTGSDTYSPGENPFVQVTSGNDGFSRVAPQYSGASSDNPFSNQKTSAHGFGPRPKPKPSRPDHHRATSTAEVEALLRPFFHHTNITAGAEQPNGSLRLSRDWVVKMLGANQFNRVDDGQLVLRPGSELNARGGGGIKLPATIIDWLEDSNGQDQVLLPAVVGKQYWTRPKYTDGKRQIHGSSSSTFPGCGNWACS
ncbi:hypothetical protein PMIN03_002342 [Paraphaeosphaeria minitans]